MWNPTGRLTCTNAFGDSFRAGRGQGPVTSSVFALRAVEMPKPPERQGGGERVRDVRSAARPGRRCPTVGA
jgi:hypothetical protein